MAAGYASSVSAESAEFSARDQSRITLRRAVFWGGLVLLVVAIATNSAATPDTEWACSISAAECRAASERAAAEVPAGTRAFVNVASVVAILAMLGSFFIGGDAVRRKKGAARAAQAAGQAMREERLRGLVSDVSATVLARDGGACRECGSTAGVEVYPVGPPQAAIGMSLSDLRDPEQLVVLCAHHGPPRFALWYALGQKDPSLGR